MKSAHLKHRADKHLVLAVAHLRSQGLIQEAIAERLEISQAEVSILLKQAEHDQILALAPPLNPEKINQADMQAMEERFFAHRETQEKLRACSTVPVHLNVHVITGNYEQFTRAAAGRVMELLHRSQRIGVMWGRTIANLMEGITHNRTIRPGARFSGVECIPLCGEPVHLMNQWEMGYSASHLAAQLESVVTGQRRPDLPCLAGVPAYVSPRILKTRPFQEFLHSIPGYNQIFDPLTKGAVPLIDLVDTVISGVGIIVNRPDAKEHETAAFIRERIAQEPISKEEMQKLILGDVGGLLFAKPHLDAAARRKVDELNQGWIGMTFKHLQRIAKAASARHAPGVIFVAFGREKAEMMVEIVRRGYANQLVIDFTLLEGLKQILAKHPLKK